MNRSSDNKEYRNDPGSSTSPAIERHDSSVEERIQQQEQQHQREAQKGSFVVTPTLPTNADNTALPSQTKSRQQQHQHRLRPQPLYDPYKDHGVFSQYHLLIRKNIQVFQATEEDGAIKSIESDLLEDEQQGYQEKKETGTIPKQIRSRLLKRSNRASRNLIRPFVGQVGLRCRFCAEALESKRSRSFDSSLEPTTRHFYHQPPPAATGQDYAYTHELESSLGSNPPTFAPPSLNGPPRRRSAVPSATPKFPSRPPVAVAGMEEDEVHPTSSPLSVSATAKVSSQIPDTTTPSSHFQMTSSPSTFPESGRERQGHQQEKHYQPILEIKITALRSSSIEQNRPVDETTPQSLNLPQRAQSEQSMALQFPRGAVQYPISWSNMMQAVQTIANIHWIDVCPYIPTETRMQLMNLRSTQKKHRQEYPTISRAMSGANFKKEAWVNHLQTIGIVEDLQQGGLVFDGVAQHKDDLEHDEDPEEEGTDSMLLLWNQVLSNYLRDQHEPGRNFSTDDSELQHQQRRNSTRPKSNYRRKHGNTKQEEEENGPKEVLELDLHQETTSSVSQHDSHYHDDSYDRIGHRGARISSHGLSPAVDIPPNSPAGRRTQSLTYEHERLRISPKQQQNSTPPQQQPKQAAKSDMKSHQQRLLMLTPTKTLQHGSSGQQQEQRKIPAPPLIQDTSELESFHSNSEHSSAAGEEGKRNIEIETAGKPDIDVRSSSSSISIVWSGYSSSGSDYDDFSTSSSNSSINDDNIECYDEPTDRTGQLTTSNTNTAVVGKPEKSVSKDDDDKNNDVEESEGL